MYELVSIVIPTKNSEKFIFDCLKSIKNQSYPQIEVIIVDSGSKDRTIQIAKMFNTKIYFQYPKVERNKFDAPYKRNFGVNKSNGKYVYYVDADMRLPKNLIQECVSLCSSTNDGLIIPENSIGVGVWARAKNLEKLCYFNDDTVEAPRFFKKDKWESVGGLDEDLGGGGDDWDLYQKFLERGYKVDRTKNIVVHNEGDLKLSKLIRKRFMYGKDSIKYISKRKKKGFISYFPIRKSYIRNWKLFVSRPKDTFFFIIMKSCEFLAGFTGILYSLIKK